MRDRQRRQPDTAAWNGRQVGRDQAPLPGMGKIPRATGHRGKEEGTAAIRSELPQVQEAAATTVAAIGSQQLQKFTQMLLEYKAGKAHQDRRVVTSENWWKLRNDVEEDKRADTIRTGFRSKSGWLHNVITSKHADAMESYPTPVILPREQGDREEAQRLSDIVPCVLEQNGFEATYSDAVWQKLKSGTGVYKVVWDKDKLNGLGDISITNVNLLNLFWEPGIRDIQKSRYFFQTELYDKDLLEQMYPQVKGKLKGNSFLAAKFQYDDTVPTDRKITVIEVYYHTHQGQKRLLQYCKYVGDVVLYATENDPELAGRGLYDHGMYPYVFDALFPIEGSPCGYGFVDLCRKPQEEIDLMKTAFVKNTMAGATPRYFARVDGSVNEEEFLDTDKAIVHVDGNLGEDSLRQIGYNGLESNYLNFLNSTIQELRETSGNTETATGTAGSGVTAASAIAALQEASGKGSKDSTRASYRAYSKMVTLVIELIRQFYDMPRSFRITGQYGAEQFVSYNNQGLQPQYQGVDFGRDMGYRLPVFDIKVGAQKQSTYTTLSNNELALQMFQMGFFHPQLVDQVLMCLDMMEFEGKDAILQKVSQQGTMQQKMLLYQQLALTLAQKYEPEMVPGLARDIMGAQGGPSTSGGTVSARMVDMDAVDGLEAEEPARVRNARERAHEASQPDGGRVISEKEA